MRIKMKVAIRDRHQNLAVGEYVDTTDRIANDLISRGYAEPAPDPEPETAPTPKPTRRRSAK